MLLLISPEVLLLLTAIVVLLMDIGYRRQRSKLVVLFALAGLLMAAVHGIITADHEAAEVFSRTLMIDRISQFFKVILIFSSLTTVILSWKSKEILPKEKSELYALLILSTFAMCVLVSAVHFLILYLAFEMVAVSAYVMASFNRRSPISSEAGLKLFVHGALTSILFAFGVVMLYGVAKTFNILDMRNQLATSGANASYLWISFGLIFSAIAARLGAFPFHSHALDALEGSPSPVSAFLSVSTTIAAMAFAIRLCINILSVKADTHWAPMAGFDWPAVLAGISAVTMTMGNLMAIHQANIKRLLAYACMAHMGNFLMGLIVADHMGVAALLFSLAAYAVMMLGAFFVIQMVTDHAKDESLSSLRGLVWRNPYEAVILCFFLLGLAGLPPLAGFIGRFYLLGAVIKEKLYWLSIVTAINWVLGLTYYLSMIRQVFSPKNNLEIKTMQSGRFVSVSLFLLVVPTVFLGFHWDSLMGYLIRSFGTLTW